MLNQPFASLKQSSLYAYAKRMGCIGSRVGGDYEGSSPTHAEQRSPLLTSENYSVSPLPESPSVNNSRPATIAVVSSAALTTPPSFNRDGEQSSADGVSPEMMTSAELDASNRTRSYGQAVPYNTANSSGPSLAASGAHSTSYATDSLAVNTNGIAMSPMGLGDVQTGRGNEIIMHLKKAYEWKTKFESPTQQFLSLMDRLYMECQLHLTALSSRGDIKGRREADVIVNEMISVRNHWGPKLLPSSICNAFVRERLTLTLGVEQRKFRVDCAQFFEPVPFYGPSHSQGNNHGELMKLYRFSVYDLSRNEVILRYYLERSNVTQLYHVLCFTCENYRGQVHPYGTENPSYWEVRHHMFEDVHSRLLSALSQGSVPAPQTHASTIFPQTRGEGPIIIQVPAAQPLTVQH